MRTFYKVMLYLSEFDLAIGRSTGRSPRYIAADAADVEKWRLLLWQEEWQLK